MKIAIPRFSDDIAPCFEHTAMISLFTIKGNTVVHQVDFPLRSRDPLDRVRLLRDQEVELVICGGVQNVYENLLRASGIDVVSWVTGTVDGLLKDYLEGRLALQSDQRQSDKTTPGKSQKKTGFSPNG